jgi:hypothetical protein
MNRLFIVVCLFVFSSQLFAAPPDAAVLPKIFAGWQQQKSEVHNTPTQVDPVNADLLKEDGFKSVQIADYAKPDRKMTVRVAAFNDATGAYAAFLYYRTPQMAQEEIADQAASNNERILFRKGNLLVDAKFDRITPMSGGELRELANDLQTAQGNSAKPPSVGDYLPTQGLVQNSLKYASGPVGLARIGSPLPAELVDFSTLAEVATADYNTGEGTAKLTIISYPTAAVSANKLRTIEAWHPAPPDGSTIAPKVYSKRSFGLVAVLTGSVSESEARTLLASVNSDPRVTWNENTHFDRNDNLGSLLVNIIILIAIIAGLAVIAGIAFGGVRVVLKRLFPDRVFDRSEDVEIIRLNIGGER